MPATDMDEIVRLCKHRGFIFPSAEIYGGFRSTYDYGPLGALMLRNVKDAWWRSMVQMRHDVVGLDAAILSSDLRSTAVSGRPTTTAPLGPSCCATSRMPGGGRWSRCATTLWASTPPSCRPI